MSKLALKGGVWSATPTPLTADFRLDVASARRLVAHHAGLGVTGLMLAGTCGEGPWLRDRDREALARTVVETAQGRLRIAMQVTDNSAVRVLENIEKAAAWGIEVAVVSAPAFFMNATPERVAGHYREIARNSRLPMGFYDRGKFGANAVSENLLPELLSEPNIAMVKDSSSMESRRSLYVAAKKSRPGLVVLDGDEFECIKYIQAGYDGLLLGGGIFNASLAARIIEAVRAGSLAEAERLNERMKDLMWRVYGGPKIECWLAGLKELLVQMGIFSTRANLLGYPLTDHCRDQITAAVKGTDGMGFRADLFGKAAPGR
jgi:4-hydroxy-tetrahydrodipicolinate synthase